VLFSRFPPFVAFRSAVSGHNAFGGVSVQMVVPVT
jgi:hypothetical protein